VKNLAKSLLFAVVVLIFVAVAYGMGKAGENEIWRRGFDAGIQTQWVWQQLGGEGSINDKVEKK
jgi:hypothetical protein